MTFSSDSGLNKTSADRYIFISDNIILSLLIIQVFSAGFSVGISSIAFGIWATVWISQIVVLKKFILYPSELSGELKILNFFLLLYIIAELLSRLFALYPAGAFYGLKRILLFLVFYISILKIKTADNIIKSIIIILFISAIFSIYEIIRYFLDLNEFLKTERLGEIRIAYFMYPLSAGEIKMMLLLSIIPLFFVKEKLLKSEPENTSPINKIWKYISKKSILFLIIIPLAVSMYLTQSRNVFVGFIISLLIYGIFFNRRFFEGFLIIGVIIWILIPIEFKDRILSIFDISHPSNETRISMWKAGLKIFTDHPLFGTGDNNIIDIYNNYKSPGDPEGHSHFHSNVMMILVTTGITGYITITGYFISMLTSQIKIFKKTMIQIEKQIIIGTILAFISYHIAGIFEWSFGDHEVMTVFFFLMSFPYIIITNYHSKTDFQL